MCPRLAFLTGVVGHSQPSVGREGTNRVRWPVSKKPMSTRPIFLTCTSLPFDVHQEQRLSGHRPYHKGVGSQYHGLIKGICQFSTVRNLYIRQCMKYLYQVPVALFISP